MAVKLKHLKPYFFIILFFSLPLILLPLLRNSIKTDQQKETGNSFDKNRADNTKVIDTVLNFGLVIHGGAGNFSPGDLPPELEMEYRTKLLEALQLGENRLKNGDYALAVVQLVISFMEDCPLFNAGKGAVFNHEGKNEMDASIMDGKTHKAGAVAGVSSIKNPIQAAYQVLFNTPHVLLIGKGAEQFAAKQNLEIVKPAYFYTKKRWNDLQKVLASENKTKFGTVGCTALDKQGNLAAGTSTGGMTNKMVGRLGDSPIIGAGTYADNESCAISATGHGEFFIRYCVAHEISARMRFLNESLDSSAYRVIEMLKEQGGYGGVIGIDRKGNITMEFNTTGMFRGFYLNGKEPQVFLYKE